MLSTSIYGHHILYHSLLCIWTSLSSVKNLPAIQETWVQFLGWEDCWTRKWQPTPVFLPGKSHGQRSLVGYSPWGYKESDMTEHAHTITQYAFMQFSLILVFEVHGGSQFCRRHQFWRRFQQLQFAHVFPGWDLGCTCIQALQVVFTAHGCSVHFIPVFFSVYFILDNFGLKSADVYFSPQTLLSF